MTNSNTTALAEHITTTNGDQPRGGHTHIEIYTDGSCIGNPGHGGYGAIILRRDNGGAILNRRELSGFELSTTNNRMEMAAVFAALESLGGVTSEPITVFSEASLISNAMNGWLANWKAKNWRKSGGKAVLNRDLWERIEAAAKGRCMTWVWVRGHNGTEHNEQADRLAFAASCKAEAKLKGR